MSALLLGLVSGALASRLAGAAAAPPAGTGGTAASAAARAAELLPPAPAPPRSEEDDVTAEAELDTPRRALAQFAAYARTGKWYDAAGMLPQLSTDVEETREQARRLAAVLERKLPIDKALLARVSDSPEGDQSDGLKRQDEIGRIEFDKSSDAVRLERQNQDKQAGGPRWKFSVGTVQSIDRWFNQLSDHFIVAYMPEALQATGFLGLQLWQWLALPLLILLGAIGGVVGAQVMRTALLRRFASGGLAQSLIDAEREPLRLCLGAFAARLLLPLLFLTPSAGLPVRELLFVAAVIGVCLGLWRVVDVLTTRARGSEWLLARPELFGAMPLLHRLSGMMLAVVAVVLGLQELGFSVTSLVAGLGLSGLAVALAAKNTLEHFFGGLALSIDQPMRVGEAVKVEDVQGTVEQIGLRSTRIRTADRTVVTYPNGKLADLKIESVAARDRSRMVLTLSVQLALRADKLRTLRDALRQRVQSHPLIWQERVRVHYVSLGDSGVVVEVQAWFQTTDQDQFLDARSDLILALVEVIEAHGATAAFAKAGHS